MSENVWERESIAFLYKWTDHKYDMYYVGYHKGTPDDGYICSSKPMLAEYKERPEDFTRDILMVGEFEYVREMETEYLKNVDAARDPKYYNKNNGDGKFYSCLMGKDNPMFEKTHGPEAIRKLSRPDSEETKKKKSEARKGDKNPMYNKTHNEEARKSISEARKSLTEEQVEEIRYLYKEENISQLDLAQMYNVSQGTIGHVVNAVHYKGNKTERKGRTLKDKQRDARKRTKTFEEAQEMRKLYEAGGISQDKLAEMFDTTRAVVRKIVNYKTYLEDV